MNFSKGVVAFTLIVASLCVESCGADDTETNLRGRQRRTQEFEGGDVQPFSHQQRREDGSKHIPEDEYIVVFKSKPTDKEREDEAAAFTSSFTDSISSSYTETETVKTYTSIIHGATMRLSPEALEYVKQHPDVEFVEENIPIHLDQTPQIQQTENLPWGLDRIDQLVGMDGRYNYGERFQGGSVHAYVIDTGIRSTHQEFAGRLGNGYNAMQGSIGNGPELWDDCHGHGSHVASTLGGSSYGVAKQVVLHAVRVFDCFGDTDQTLADILEGMDWVSRQQQNNPGQKSVVNMSLGGRYSHVFNKAAAGLASLGMFVAVSAGNSNRPACDQSPASADNVVTVAATNVNDRRAWYSNYGQCVDIFAPGSDVLGASSQCDECTSTKTGTSMASPHVAGVAALVMDGGTTNLNDVRDFILGKAGAGLISNARGSPNVFLQAPRVEEEV